MLCKEQGFTEPSQHGHHSPINMSTLSLRFWKRVNKGSPDECWPWQGPAGNNGYGKTSVKKRSISAHRAAYQLTYGDIPKGLCVLHRCDVKLCCNPKHLFLGTRKDNSQDCFLKGRTLKGEKHWAVKLTTQNVEQIRNTYKTTTGTKRKLARKFADLFGCTPSNVRMIVRRQSWEHL